MGRGVRAEGGAGWCPWGAQCCAPTCSSACIRRMSWFSLARRSSSTLMDCMLCTSPLSRGGFCGESWGLEGVGCGSGGAEDAASPIAAPLLTLPLSGTASCSMSVVSWLITSAGPGEEPHGDIEHSTQPHSTALPAHRLPRRRNHLERRGRDSDGDLHLSPTPIPPPTPPTPGPPDSPETISRATATNASAPSSSLLALSPSSLPSSCITRRGMGAGGGVPAGGWWWTCRRRSPSTSSSLLVQLPSSSSGSGEGWGTVGRAHRLALLLGAPPRTPHGADLQCDPQHAAPAQCCASPAPSCPRH